MLGRRDVLRAAAAIATVACGGSRALTAQASGGSAGERVEYGRAESTFAVLRTPSGPGPHPVVVLLHGGYWLRAYGLDLMIPLADALGREGFATWNVEYRRLGEPGAGFPGTFVDVATATDRLAALAPRHALDLAHVSVVGHSAGGQLALWLAGPTRRRAPFASESPVRVARAVALAPVTDLRRLADGGSRPVRQLLGDDPATLAERCALVSPIEILPLGVPQVVLHGTADSLLPLAWSERYVETARARGDDATLVKLDGLGHLEVVDPTSSAWPHLLRAVRGT